MTQINFDRAYRLAEQISLSSESQIHSVFHDIEVAQFREGQTEEVRKAIGRQFLLFEKWKRASSNFDAKCYAIQKCIGLLFELNDREMLQQAFELYEQALERNRKPFKQIVYYCELASWLHRFGNEFVSGQKLDRARSMIPDLPVPKAKYLAGQKLVQAYEQCNRKDEIPILEAEYPDPTRHKPRKPKMKSLSERISDHIKAKEYAQALDLMRLEKLDPYYRSVGAFEMALSYFIDGNGVEADRIIDSLFVFCNNHAAYLHPTIALMQFRLGYPEKARKTFFAKRDFELFHDSRNSSRIGFFQNLCGFYDDTLETAIDTANRADDAPNPFEAIQDGRYPATLLLLLGETARVDQWIDASLEQIRRTPIGKQHENFDFEYTSLAVGSAAGADIRDLPGVTLRQSKELFGYDLYAGFSDEYVDYEENRIPS